MWAVIKGFLGNVGGVWKSISVVLALYGLFSTLLVRWYGHENKVYQKEVQEVSQQLLKAKEGHLKYVQSVIRANSIAKEGGEAKAEVDKKTEELKHERRGAKVIPDDVGTKLLKQLSNDVNKSARQAASARRDG